MTKEDSKYSYTEVDCSFQVSNHTAEWIRIYVQMQVLWQDIIAIINNEQGEDLAFQVLETSFTPSLFALRESILQGVSNSIFNSLREENNKNVL